MFRNGKLKRIISLGVLLCFLLAVDGSLYSIAAAEPIRRQHAPESQGGQTEESSPSGLIPDILENEATSGTQIKEAPSKGQTDLLEKPKPKKSMSSIEKGIWGFVRTLLPSLVSGLVWTAAIAFTVATFGAGAPALLAAAGITGLVAAGTSAAVNTAYELRMNQFREPPKDGARIARDVAVAAVKDGIAGAVLGVVNAVFPGGGAAAGSGLSQVAKAALTFGAKKGAAMFAGNLIGVVAAGGTKNLFNKYVVKIDDEKAAVKKELDSSWKEYRETGDENKLKRVRELAQKLNELEGETYSWNDLKRDAAHAAWSAAIGVAAGTVAKTAGSTFGARDLSVRIFKDTKHSELIAKFITNLPIKFVEGTGHASMDRKLIEDELVELRAESKKYPADDWHQAVISDRVKTLETARSKINILKSGADSFTNSLKDGAFAIGGAWASKEIPPALKNYANTHENATGKTLQKVAAILEKREKKKPGETPPESLEDIGERKGEKFEKEAGYVALTKNNWDKMRPKAETILEKTDMVNLKEFRKNLMLTVEEGNKTNLRENSNQYQRSFSGYNLKATVENGKVVDFDLFTSGKK